MADDIKVQDENLDDTELETEDGSQPSKPSGEEPESPLVPLSRLRQKNDEIKKLKEENERLKNAGSPNPLSKQSETIVPDEEKKFREVLSKIEREKQEQVKQEEKMLQEELETLHDIYGSFNDKKLLSLVNDYGVYDDGGNVKWDKAMDLYQKLNIDPSYKPPAKLPSSKLSGDRPLEKVEPVAQDFSKKSMGDLVSEGLSKFGIKR